MRNDHRNKIVSIYLEETRAYIKEILHNFRSSNKSKIG